jgi:hypothetical protein
MSDVRTEHPPAGDKLTPDEERDAATAQPPPAGDTLPGKESDPAKVNEVLAEELGYIHWHRHASQRMEEVDRNLIGLAFSGGGIRSATTCLGILQALSKMQILPLVDYISTVSGGGYIGACLSSLLSLNKYEIERLPDDKPNTRRPAEGGDARPTKPFTYLPEDNPGFSTQWGTFPFRAEQRDRLGRRATDLVAHLRTHGNFLVARRGLFKRETMRAVGHLLSGITFNIGIFLATLFTAAAIGMAAARLLIPEMHGSLLGSGQTAAALREEGPRPAVPPLGADTASLNQPAGASSIPQGESVGCPPGSAGCIKNAQTGEHSAPSYWDRAKRNGNLIVAQVGAAPWLFPIPLLVGVGLTLIALLVLSRRNYLKAGDAGKTVPEAGESKADRFEVGLLWLLFWVALLLVVATTLYMRFVYIGCPDSSRPLDLLLLCATATSPQRLSGDSQLLILLVPAAVLLGAAITSFIVAVGGPSIRAWNRRWRSLWSAYQAITIYGWWIMLALAAVPVAAYSLHDYQARLGFSAAGAVLLTRLLASRRAIIGIGKIHLPPAVRRALLAIAVVLALALGLIFFSSLLVGLKEAWVVALVAGAGVLSLLVVGILVDQNKIGPHYFYRDRLAETYLLSEIADTEGKLHTYRDAMDMPLAHLHGEPADPMDTPWKNSAPYHLISTAINLGGSRDLTRKDRKSGYWLFSKLYCGSTHTGFRPTAKYRNAETKLARAIAISGAAASSAMGTATFFAQAFATVVFNIRLGYWMENPHHDRSRTRQEGLTLWPLHLWKELSMNTTEHGRLVNLSDGGHTGDNVGIYPLLQRQCKVIIACDAERDPGLTFGSFTEALRHAYIDLGVAVDIDLTMIRRDPETGYSRSHCAVGRIMYPHRTDQESFLIYIKNSLNGDEPEPTLNYQSANPAFPHETTMDQFFDDAQFESYRALGVHLAEHTFSRWNTTKGFKFVSQQQWPW